MRELSLNILDITQNSIAADATVITIFVEENTRECTLFIGIYDNGKGMTPEQAEMVKDPFFTTRRTRRVGMGIPLFKLAAEQTGGTFTIVSALGEGTRVEALFKTDSIDYTPLGDMAETVASVVCMNADRDFIYTRSVDGREFTFKSADIKKILDGVSISEPAVMQWIEDYIREKTLFIERND